MTRTYRPREDVIVAFTEGDCWLLAKTMSKMSGLPLIFADPTGGELTDYWEHVGLWAGPDAVLDILGLHSIEDWRYRWAPFGIVYTESEPDRLDVLIGGQYRSFSTRPNRPARRLLRSYAEHLTPVNG